MQPNLNAINQLAHGQNVVKSGVVPSFQKVNEAMAKRNNHGATTEAYNQYVGNIVKVQQKSIKNEVEKTRQNEKIKQIHNQLNQSAETYSKMYDMIKKEKEKAVAQAKQPAESEQDQDYDEEEESEEDLFDYNVLSKLRF